MISFLNRWRARINRRLGRVQYPVGSIQHPKLLAEHLIRLFDLLQINCVFDVGANQGQYGTFLRQSGYRGTIHSFEPASRDFSRLAQLARPDPLWQTHHLALGDQDGVSRLNITSDSLFNSFLAPNDFIIDQGLTVTAQEEVPVKRLDTIFDSLIAPIAQPRIYLKLDTQGYDLRVLAGAQNSLGRVLALQAELSVQPLYDQMPGYLETLRVLNEAGYDLTGMFPIARDNNLRVIEFDCVLIGRAATSAPQGVYPA